MFGICQSDNGGGGGELAAAPDEPDVDAFTTVAFEAIVLCSIFWLVTDEFDCDGCDWEDTPAAAAAAATANADKSFLFFLLRFLADDAVPMGSTHITCVWFFYVLLNWQADFDFATKFPHKKTNEQKKKIKKKQTKHSDTKRKQYKI